MKIYRRIYDAPNQNVIGYYDPYRKLSFPDDERNANFIEMMALVGSDPPRARILLHNESLPQGEVETEEFVSALD